MKFEYLKRCIKIPITFLFVLSSLIILAQFVIADDVNECIKINNINCTNCLTLSVSLTTGSGEDEFVIGDYQTYRIIIRNIGKNTVNTTLIVRIYDPKGNEIGTIRRFKIFLYPDENVTIIPNQTIEGNIVDIYPFDIVGTYKIKIESTTPITFYRFFPKRRASLFYCSYSFSPYYVYHYDVISKAEKEWRDILRDWQKRSEELNKTMLEISQTMYFLTIISTIFVAYTVFREGFMKITIEKIVLTFFLFIIWILLGFSNETVNLILSLPTSFFSYLNFYHKVALSILWQYILSCFIVENIGKLKTSKRKKVKSIKNTLKVS